MVKLIRSGFRKDRTILTVFLFIIVISTFLLHSGIFASMYPRLYDEYADSEGLADYMFMTNADDEDIENTLSCNKDIGTYTIQDMVYLNSLKLTTSNRSKETKERDWVIQRLGDNIGYDRLNFEKRDDSVSGSRIYINAYTAISNDLDIGDIMYLDTEFGKYEYTVAGIYQHLLMGNSYSYISVLLDNESFAEMSEAQQKSGSTAMRVGYVNADNCDDIDKSMQQTMNSLKKNGEVYAEGFNVSLCKESYTVIVNVLAGFMAVFALIIMIICIIMIVFTINNNISRDIINIGALRAVGYTVGQIRAALTAEYVILGIVGSISGIILSYVVFPIAEQMFIREICGIIWKNRSYPAITSVVFAGLAFVIVTAAFFSTRKIKKLHPAMALRFGLKSNSFKKNHFPLSETKGELNILLALKSSMQNMGQNITIFFIITAVAFVAVFSGLLFYNTKVDITNFQRMIQGDAPDAYIYLEDTSYDSACSAIEKIKNINGISQIYGLDSITANVGGSDVDLLYVTEPDYVYCGIYDGEIMRRDNEAVVGSTVAERLGVGVGDEIEVTYGDESRRYLVTGLQQAVLANRIYMTDKGAQAIGVNTTYGYLRARVKDATAEKVDKILCSIESMKECGVSETRNYYRYVRSNDNTPVYAIGFIVLIMVFLSVATVLFVIRLLLKTVFIKKEREFGIKKAVGFTSTQLRYQLSMSLMPTTIIASVLGSVLGYFILNPLFTLILGGYGIRDANLLLQPLVILITAVGVTIMVFVFCFLMSGRMKKVSVYKLIQE
ncbi:ABC transporter permease [Ruminococcus flavefaciens]|uniref:ABC transporter permease n=1 Tax=Ruminococcus flavefaciens TaxID=1265 RepID=UPI0026EE0F61|nr:ABC transporter permease [Ruminococcus flavefaciens]MDD7515893.1 ABC transporter permease [Ruminococcus flavefaciens]MDY5691774.1 ABC transporter permease [Ruminococcus flavefaciens]